MTSLAIEFAGLQLENPVIAASAPPTETLDSIIKCAEAGAGAIVTKSSANYDPSKLAPGGRRAYMDDAGIWAQGSFRHETLTIEAGARLVSQSVRAIRVPIIASVGNLSLDPKEWLNSCKVMQDAGADMIQLDLFYLPQPRCSPDNVKRLVEMLHVVTTDLSIPVAPKLNLDIPAHYAAQILRGTGISAVFLIDSVRVAAPIDIEYGGQSRIRNLDRAKECSLFGAWQKPLTLQYTSVMHHELGLPISAGGGLMTGWDAIEAMMLGAATVQYATAIIRNGNHEITRILKQIHLYMERNHVDTLEQILRLAHKQNSPSTCGNDEDYVPTRAQVDPELCVRCGACTRLVFCQDIHLNSEGRVQIEDTCNGCGLCPTVCPIPGALTLHPRDLLSLDVPLGIP